MSERATILSNERLRQALAVRDWLVGEEREISDPNVIWRVSASSSFAMFCGWQARATKARLRRRKGRM
jgi:hypothetical protein